MNYQLVWNRDTAQYEMVSIQVPQQSMFDDSYEYGENADDDNPDEEEGK